MQVTSKQRVVFKRRDMLRDPNLFPNAELIKYDGMFILKMGVSSIHMNNPNQIMLQDIQE